jgi:hypothetical protein
MLRSKTAIRVHGQIGVAEQRVGVVVAGCAQCHANAGGDEDVPSIQRNGTTQDIDDTPGHFSRIRLARDVLEQDSELVATQAGDGVLDAHAAANP